MILLQKNAVINSGSDCEKLNLIFFQQQGRG